MNYLLLTNLSATIEIIALALLLILALYGYLQGFTKTFFSLFGTIIALILAISLSSPAISYMQDKFGVVSTMSKNVSSLVNNIFGKELMQTKLSEATANYLNSAGISGVLIKIILSVKNEQSFAEDTVVGDVICPTIAYYIVLIIAVLILYIIIKLIFRIIGKIVKKAYKSKGVALTDRMLGLVLGILHGIIVIELLILLISVLPFGFAQNLYAGIKGSSIASFIERINLVGMLSDKIISTNVIKIILSII